MKTIIEVLLILVLFRWLNLSQTEVIWVWVFYILTKLFGWIFTALFSTILMAIKDWISDK